MAERVGRRSQAGAMALSTAGVVVFVLPLYLTGALAVQMSEDLAFGAAILGVAVGIFRGSAAVTSTWLGRAADRWGASRAFRVSAVVAAVSSAGLALAARGPVSLCAWLVLGGSAHALGQPAANRLLMRNVPRGRRGLAFGLKQSALPTASALAGLSVPTIAVLLGWRWAFLLGAIGAVVIFVVTGRPPERTAMPQTEAPSRSHLPRRTLWTLAVALGLGMAAASSVPAFFVDASVTGGLSPDRAGTVLGVASAAAVAVRLGAGWLMDRLTRGHLFVCAGMLATGSVGLVALATGRAELAVLGCVVALAAGWGFNGVFWFALVEADPTAPGAVTGAVAPGGLVGGTLGPVLFGIIAEQVGYGVAWSITAGLPTAAAAAMVIGAVQLRRATASAAAARHTG
jgi:MFS family permease